MYLIMKNNQFLCLCADIIFNVQFKRMYTHITYSALERETMPNLILLESQLAIQ